MGNKLYFTKFFHLLLKKFRPFSDFTFESKVLWFFSQGQWKRIFWDWLVKLHNNSFQTPHSISAEDFLRLVSSSSCCACILIIENGGYSIWLIKSQVVLGFWFWDCWTSSTVNEKQTRFFTNYCTRKKHFSHSITTLAPILWLNNNQIIRTNKIHLKATRSYWHSFY